MNSAHELVTLIDALRTLHSAGHSHAALATLTRTRGSTFRRPGTRMLVFGDDHVVCELSGGCPQRDIVLRAQEVIASGEPRLVNYNAESGLDVLMEMGCGGELEVLIEPIGLPHASDFVDALARCLEHRHRAHLATLFAVNDKVVMPRRLLWCDAVIRHDDLGDAALSEAVMAAANLNDSGRATTLRIPSPAGTADVLIELIAPTHALVVIGSSAAAQALLPLADALGWRTVLVDQDSQRLQAADLPTAALKVCASPVTIRQLLPLDAHSSVVVMTHNLEQDIAYLAALRGAPVAYLGALGSRERVGRMRHEPALEGLRLHAPAGLDIGSETPEEIALAVTAEIMAVINGRDGGPLRDNQGAIH
ncbi:XdhC family protein [Pinirhizobacter soli]|uniref:XdhC family protein n=1 Tax=Pinirhizobacter soli TaxID=2786953 RepID=UPI002029ECD6